MEAEDRPADHLRRVVLALSDCGLVELVREEVRQLWRANCERYEPEQLFDDAATLGFVAARNVSNAVRELVRQENIAESTLDEFGVMVFHIQGFAVRLVKAPGSLGRSPDMNSDFDWRGRESRLAAAQRNDRYRRPLSVLGHEPLFDFPEQSPNSDLTLLNDVFVVWGGDAESRLTAGWVGLPTSRDGSWAAVEELWRDRERPESAAGLTSGSADAVHGILGSAVPTPIVRLRQRASRIEAE